ncbi:MAG: Histidinol dehydrogenase [Alphaproteobacteria bacterium MarineAlpha9_Bin4]|nr:histidinol dehydrogenase [Pelagibacterales bacterium]PPR24901.1 MAG: Histidinol dehydrogenase [Alphaproteobacteria bacterium MarineAlpha9_Bin4]|tara:strand:- start:937 stop:2238 length:1302 start_codon:yes stop_codon:yes gene_type:complete
MLKVVSCNTQNYKKKLKKYLEKDILRSTSRIDTVRKIINEVQKGGDRELLNLTNKYDDNNFKNIKEIEVSKKSIENSLKYCSREFLNSTKIAISRVKNYQKKLLPKDLFYKDKKGTKLGCLWKSISSCGLYIPGGKAIYPSSVYMNAVAAKLAGVKRIVLVSPAKEKKISPEILATAKLSGVDKVYMIGGAQAIAALAYGTKTIEKVDKIFGPGNAFVAEAKKQVFGDVGIDSVAGPSEIMIVADNKSNPEWIAIDLLSQAEHDEDARAILLTDSLTLIKSVNNYLVKYLKILDRKKIASFSIRNNGIAIKIPKLSAAYKVIDLLAPEHLQIICKGGQGLAKKVNNAGAIFVGSYTPEAFGDYVAGPSHVLPTSGNARFESGLSVLDFFKRSSYIEANKEGLFNLVSNIDNLANIEGLTAHALSANIRFLKRN